MVLAIQKWRPYLLGCKFIIQTDQQSLKYLWDQQITTVAQQKWLTKLMGFDFTIEYKKGCENNAADALSRRDESGELAALSQPVPRWLDPIKDEVTTDAHLQCLVQLCKEDEAVGSWDY